MKNLIVFGAGAVGKFVAWNLELFEEPYNLVGFVDEDRSKAGGLLCGAPVFGREYLTPENIGGTSVIVAVSSPEVKARVAGELESLGALFPNLVARTSWISNGVTIGRGILVYPGCAIDYETSIGDFVTINQCCSIGHNAMVGDYATISPGVCLGGHTTVGEGAFLGIGCCTRQGVGIGARSVIGGQAMVIGDVEPGKTVTGVPGKVR